MFEGQQLSNLNFSNGFITGKPAMTQIWNWMNNGMCFETVRPTEAVPTASGQGLVSFSATRWHCWCIVVNLL